MESAIPIAQADAATFANMDIENMRNKQTVALANAAAAQGFELANLSISEDEKPSSIATRAMRFNPNSISVG